MGSARTRIVSTLHLLKSPDTSAPRRPSWPSSSRRPRCPPASPPAAWPSASPRPPMSRPATATSTASATRRASFPRTPTTDAMAWSGPVTTSSCFIGNKCIAEGTPEPVGYSCSGRYGPTTCYKPDPCSKCIPSVSGTAYSPVAEKGCKLDMATFTAACYDDQGNMTMTDTDKDQLMADKASMMTTMVTRDATIATHADTIKGLETSDIELAADLKTAKADNDGEKMPTWAIAIIVVIGAMFLLVVVILGVIVSREQQGKPVFVPSAMNKKTVRPA